MLYWIIFLVFCIIHLVSCFLENELIRRITKVFILPLLFIGLVINNVYNTFLFVGIILGWIGDILLIYKKKITFFICGTIFFALGHFSYIFLVISDYFKTSNELSVPLYLYILILLELVLLLSISKIVIVKRIGNIAYFGATYFAILLSVFTFCIFTNELVLALAFLIFIISDSTLSIFKFGKSRKREHFYIMTTYILAQFLICVNYIYFN